MTPVRPLVTHMDFVCAKCGCRTGMAFTDGVYIAPTKCTGGGVVEMGVRTVGDMGVKGTH